MTLTLAACQHQAVHGPGQHTGSPDGGVVDAGPPPSAPDMTLGPLAIHPLDPVVVVHTGQTAPTITFIVTAAGQSVPAAVFLDRGELGTLDTKSGLFTAGQLGGKGHVTATYQGETVSTSVTVQIDATGNGDPDYDGTKKGGNAGGWGGVGGDGPGGPASGTQTGVLDGMATPDAAVKLLYPYDATVFPRGLLAPLLMWNAGAHNFEAAKLELTSKNGNYHFVGYYAKPFGAAAFTNLIIPTVVWNQMSYSASGDEVTLALTFAEGGKAFGPYQRKLVFAPATLRGTVFYNAYNTKLNTGGGAVLAIRPGQTDPQVIGGSDGSCRVCHSVSASGNRALTQRGEDYNQDSLFDVSTGMPAGKGTDVSTAMLAFSGLSPDGSVVFSQSSRMPWTDATSRFYDLTSSPPGAALTFANLPADLRAGMPSFSPDGKHLVFNAFAGGGIGDNVSLATMDVDLAGRSVSNLKSVFKPASGYAIWPSYLPKGDAVVFENETLGALDDDWGRTWHGHQGSIWWIDLASGKAHALDNLNGANGVIPAVADVPGADAGHGNDTVLNYEPTVDPVTSGGYAWVVFTSRRMYGNLAAGDPYGTASIPTKKLWISAIDLNATPGTDASHPAFYLPAQEQQALNSRGFWTTEPCRANGQTCDTGDECCGGYCEPGPGGTLQCTATPPACAQLSEKCTTASDCCPSANGPVDCVMGYCALANMPIQ